MKTLIDFLSDRRNLCKFYLYAMMVIIAVVPFFFGRGTDLSFLYTLNRAVCSIWTLFLLLSDLIHHRVPKGLLSWSSAWLCAAACLSLIFGTSSPSSGQIAGIFFLIMTSYLAVTVGFYHSDTFSDDFDPLFRILAIELFGLAAVSLIMFLFYKNGYESVFGIPYDAVTSPRVVRVRYSGILGFATAGGYHLIAGLILCFYLSAKKKLPVWFRNLDILVSMVMIMLEDARNAYLEAAIIVLLLLYRWMRTKMQAKQVKWILAGAAAAVVIFYVLRDASMNDPSNGTALEYLNRFTSGRLALWAGAVKGFLSNPVFGQGWLNGSAITAVDPTLSNAHNVFMNVLLWTGLAGMIPFCIFLIGGLIRILRNRRNLRSPADQWLMVLVICILWGSMLSSVSIIGDDSHLVSILFYLSFGYLYYLTPRKEKALK